MPNSADHPAAAREEKMAIPLPVIVGTAKITIRSLPPRVFEALLDATSLKSWWSSEALVEAQVGGRYETNPSEGRQEGIIVGLEAPRKITFTWPIPVGESVVETMVTYELSPKGSETVVHVVQRAREFLAHDWNATWERALEALKSYLEAESAA